MIESKGLNITLKLIKEESHEEKIRVQSLEIYEKNKMNGIQHVYVSSNEPLMTKIKG